MIIINLNGPAGSGKDVICKELVAYINNPSCRVVHMEFKSMLFDIAIRAAGISRKLWLSLYEREYKEVPSPYLMINGKQVSPRDWMIHCSESLMKPTFGNDVFGKAFSTALMNLDNQEFLDGKGLLVVVISDGGFIEESIPVVEYAGAENYFLVRLQRKWPDGSYYDFTGDSRRYIFAEEFPGPLQMHDTQILNEEGDLYGTVVKIVDWVEKTKGIKLRG